MMAPIDRPVIREYWKNLGARTAVVSALVYNGIADLDELKVLLGDGRERWHSSLLRLPNVGKTIAPGIIALLDPEPSEATNKLVPPPLTDRERLRLISLAVAHDAAICPEEVVERAEAYLKFLEGAE